MPDTNSDVTPDTADTPDDRERSRAARAARRLLAADGATVARALPDGRVLALAHLRTGPPSATPILVVPGGPGMASAVTYEGLRTEATKRSMDLLMVEHRGVGLSRRDRDGADLRVNDVTLEAAADDLAAVLDARGIERTVAYGSSYGTYLAQTFAVRHPERVAALVLDSPMLDVESDLTANRAHRRRLLWDGNAEEAGFEDGVEDGFSAEDAAAIRAAAANVRALAESRDAAELAHAVQVVFEFAGPQTLHRLTDAWLRGRAESLWRRITTLGAGETDGPGMPYVMEPDLVAGISYGELGYALPPDGGPLDPQHFFTDATAERPAYRGTPLDLRAQVPHYPWPTVVVSGQRDLRTPPPVAREIARLAPRGVFVPLAATGHSALDTHRLAALAIAHAVVAGHADRIPARVADLAALPRSGPSAFLGPALRTAARLTPRPRRP